MICDNEDMNSVQYKSMAFSIRIVNLSKFLVEHQEFTLSRQILRSGTSTGANIAEGEAAVSDKDFLNKRYIALKECYETIYWLQLLVNTEYLTESMYYSLYSDCNELRKMLIAITKTVKDKIEE